MQQSPSSHPYPFMASLDAVALEEQLLAILELSTDPIFIKDTQLRYQIINPAAAAVAGITTAEAVGKTDFDLFDADTARQMGDIDRFVMIGTKPLTYEHIRIVRGQERTLQTTKVPYRTSEGKVLGVIGISRDITSHVEIERSLAESETRFHQMFEVSPDGILIIDVDTREILDCNTAACQMNGYERHELVGQSIDIINYPLDDDEYQGLNQTLSPFEIEISGDHAAYINLIRQHGSLRFHTFHRRKDGSRFPVEVSTTIMTLAGQDVLVGFDRDISDRIEAQQHKLEQERLRAALDKEHELSRLKSQMMARVSHEFRTPLTVMLSSIEALERYSDRMTEAQQQQKRSQIKTMIGHMTEMMDDLQYVVAGDIDKLAYDPQSVDLSGLFVDVIERTQQTMGQHHQFESRVEVEPALIEADPHLLRLILTNLVSNAVKYSPAGSTVSLKVYRDDDRRIKFQVRDQGIGILPSERDRLYIPFFRGSNFDERPGLGIGLSIVMNAVKAHHAQIELTSSDESGTCFTVSLAATS